MTDETHDDRSDLSPAGEVFAEFLALVEDGTSPDLETFCTRHPEIADELRALYARWRDLVAPADAFLRQEAGDSARAEELIESVRGPESGERYDDRGVVGRGGMGEVRAAYDRKLRRTLAIKTLLDTAGAEGSRGLARFLDEARISAQLEHPGIVPVHELGLDSNGRVYFSMPLIRGRDLGEIYALSRDGDADWTRERILSALQRVCDAVSFAHSRGVLHRDLKPANVMVGPFGETYVMDWGLAKVLRDDQEPAGAPTLETERGRREGDSSLLTIAGAVVGTPSYLAPEQASGAPVDERADVYSLGAMLYELLAGQKPYAASIQGAEAGQALGLLSALAKGPPAPPSSLADDVPAELEAICERAMAHDPDGRYPSVAALGHDLRAYLEGRVVAAHRTGAVVELRKWVARNRATAAAATTAVLVAVTGSVGLGWRESVRRAEVEAKNEELDLARRREQHQAEVARQRTAEVLRLSDLGILDELEARASALWPRTRGVGAELDAWIAEAETLISRGEREHRPTLAGLRERAIPYNEDDRAADERRQDGYAEREWYREMLADRRKELDEFVERRDAGDTSAKLGDNIERWSDSVGLIESLLEPLEAQPFVRMTWRFATQEERWEHDTLSHLVARIDQLGPEAGLLADVRARRAELDRLVLATLDGEEARARWDEAIASIQNPDTCPAYAGLSLQPQFGLLPLGRNARSGLWEFAHLQSGEAPRRDAATGELLPAEEMGVVLILIPGGEAVCGAQTSEPDGTHYDPHAAKFEAPVHAVALEPYFLSKYELTQSQWLRARGDNPADLRPGRHDHATGLGADTTLLHPVETVSWSESTETMRRLGLLLPTEAQWEAAARAGTGTPWYTGAEVGSIAVHVNAADLTLRDSGQRAVEAPVMEWLDDGYALHAPVGSFLPNPNGLYDVLGNVSEWCADDYSPYPNPPRAGDGLRTMLIPSDRVSRGGGCMDSEAFLRSGARDTWHGDAVSSTIGVRPARALDPTP
ncbi:MAG: SUMF1/EgtB/PvdO family nonheme iron enzyme [Planctomycetota bacterium]